LANEQGITNKITAIYAKLKLSLVRGLHRTALLTIIAPRKNKHTHTHFNPRLISHLPQTRHIITSAKALQTKIKGQFLNSRTLISCAAYSVLIDW